MPNPSLMPPQPYLLSPRELSSNVVIPYPIPPVLECRICALVRVCGPWSTSEKHMNETSPFTTDGLIILAGALLIQLRIKFGSQVASCLQRMFRTYPRKVVRHILEENSVPSPFLKLPFKEAAHQQKTIS